MVYSFKLCIVGDGGVGKTSLVRAMSNEPFEKMYLPTEGVTLQPITYNRGERLSILNCWDTSGQEKYGHLHKGYWESSDAFIIMFDVTSRISFNNALKWLRDIREEYEAVPIIIIGNKVERPDRKVELEEVEAVLDKLTTYQPYYEISVKGDPPSIDRPLSDLADTLLAMEG